MKAFLISIFLSINMFKLHTNVEGNTPLNNETPYTTTSDVPPQSLHIITILPIIQEQFWVLLLSSVTTTSPGSEP
jgi:hypothetical protein